MPADYDIVGYGEYVLRCRRALRWNQTMLAEKWGLGARQKGTISQIESGKRRVSAEDRARLMDLLLGELAKQPGVGDGLTRREFLKRATLATSATVVGGAHYFHHLRNLYVDHFDMDLARWEARLFDGHAHDVLEEALEKVERLQAEDWLHTDPHLAALTARVGSYLGRAQETVVGYYNRVPVASATYTRVVQEVLAPALERFPKHPDLLSQHASLLTLRITLQLTACHDDGDRGWYRTQLDQAIDQAQRAEDLRLWAQLQRNHAYLEAVLGRVDDCKRALEQASKVVAQAPPQQQKSLLGLLIYHRAEDKKRLAFNHRKEWPLSQRSHWAQSAIADFQESRRLLEDQWRDHAFTGHTEGHPLISRLSEAQCRLWTETDALAALREHLEEDLAPLAARAYPTLLPKLTFTTDCLNQLDDWVKRWTPHTTVKSPPPRFDLSGQHHRKR